MIVAIALLLVGLGTVAFHFLSPWWWTPIASNWGYVDDTIIVTFWITRVVFVALQHRRSDRRDWVQSPRSSML